MDCGTDKVQYSGLKISFQFDMFDLILYDPVLNCARINLPLITKELVESVYLRNMLNLKDILRIFEKIIDN